MMEVCTLCGVVELSSDHQVIQESHTRKTVIDNGLCHILLKGKARAYAIRGHDNGGVFKPKTLVVPKTPPVVELVVAPDAPVAVVEAPLASTPAAPTRSNLLTEPQKPQPVEPLFQPDPNDWLYAVVTSTHENCVMATLDNDEIVVVPKGIANAPGSHQCEIGLPVGKQITLRMARTTSGKAPYVALEARGDEGSPSIGLETATIVSWSGNHGTVQRPCGCHCFSWLQHSADNLAFRTGDTVEVQIKPNDLKGWVAEIQPYTGEEF